MPIVNKPDMNYGTWAENGNIEIPSSEKVEEGWVIEKPLNEHMNWLQNRQDKMLQYLNQRGMPEWDFRTEYPLDAFVARSGVIYKAISPNTDNDPTLQTDIWKIAFVSYSDFVDYAEKIDSIENEDGYLGLYVSKSNPVMIGSASAPSYNSPNGDSGFLFQDGVAKVRKGLGITAEFSGGTNPKDVVTHEQLALSIQNYKVGDIYLTTGSGDPRTRLGYGTWERFAQGETLVGFSTSVSNETPQWVKTAGSSFGNYEHTLTVDELASHNHASGNFDKILRVTGTNTMSSGGNVTAGEPDLSASGIASLQYIGENKPHNNVQPSIVVYFWKRIA